VPRRPPRRSQGSAGSASNRKSWQARAPHLPPHARVLIIAPLFSPAFRGGGPIRTLAALVENAPTRFELRVITSDRDLGSIDRLPVPSNAWTTVTPPHRVWYMSADRPGAIHKALRAGIAWQPDLVYCNGYFDPVFSIIARAWFRAHGKQILIAPRGEFSKAALGMSRAKKRMFRRVARWTRLDSGVLWHASTPREADDIRDEVGQHARIIVRENDNLLPATAAPPERVGEPAKLVFVSRLVENKGLHILLEALQSVRAPFTLDVFGVEEQPEYADRCRSIAASEPLRGRVHFHGPLAPEHVRAKLAEHDLFAFPTATENFGHVIAEALSVSCPVMISDTTPWTARIEEGGGIRVADRVPTSWTHALQDYLVRDAGQRLELRSRAGAAFNAWRSGTRAPHVLQLVANELDAPSA
jgi:glycosyltransferase involved in cell wall biosynthesis